MMGIWLAGLAFAGTWERARERYQAEGYVAPTMIERIEYGALVRDLAVAAPHGTLAPDLARRAAGLGLRLDVGEGVAVLAEEEGARRGVGLVAVRLGPIAGEVVLQAPHPLTDLHTGAITGALFDAGEVRAVCIATVRRDAGERSDPSASPESWLTAATQGLAEALPDPLFVQLHGFGKATSDAEVVVSGGSSRLPPADLAVATRRLRVGLAVSDLRTGADVPSLAGRNNAQGTLLAGRARFLHVELSEPVRRALAEGEDARAGLADALLLLAARDEVLP